MRLRISAALGCASLFAALALGVAAPIPAAARHHLAALEPSRLGAIGPRFRDRVLSGPVRTVAAVGQSSFWGGPVTASTGETLKIYVSDEYGEDEGMRQAWADFLVQLYHGPELDQVTILVAPLSEVQTICGPNTGGCYSAAAGAAVAPGEDLPDGTSKETVLVHELGHNVAANRDNAPWSAVDWGTKRWATYMNVCARQGAGTAFPGDEAGHYLLNPGEAFAETYRLLNFQLLSLTSTIWNADPSFFPDQGALDAVREDVLAPWVADTTTTWSGRLAGPSPGKAPVVKKPAPKQAQPTRSPASFAPLRHTIATPLDGDLRIALTHAPAGTKLSLQDAAGTVLVAPTAGPTDFTVCGQRSV